MSQRTADRVRHPDTISTSSSTLVNLDSDADVRPWEMVSSHLLSSASSQSSQAPSRADTDDTQMISPRPDRNRATSRNPETLSPFRSPAHISLTDLDSPHDPNSSPRRNRRTVDVPASSLAPCPDDCRCSDQEIERGLCRCALNSSSSDGEATFNKSEALARARFSPRRTPNRASQSTHNSSSSPRRSSMDGWSGRDIVNDPVLIPKSDSSSRDNTVESRSPRKSVNMSRLSLFHRSPELASDLEQEESALSSSRTRLLGNWARRPDRGSHKHDTVHSDGPVPAMAATHDSPLRSASSPIPGDRGSYLTGSASFSASRRTPTKRITDRDDDLDNMPLSAPPAAGKYAAHRRSIAAIFEKMQEERERRAQEEKRLQEEKRAQRERERAARALGWHRRRTSHGEQEGPSFRQEQPASEEIQTVNEPEKETTESEEDELSAQSRAMARLERTRFDRFNATTPTITNQEISTGTARVHPHGRTTQSDSEPETGEDRFEQSGSKPVGLSIPFMEDLPTEEHDQKTNAASFHEHEDEEQRQTSPNAGPNQLLQTPEISSGFTFPALPSPATSSSSVSSPLRSSSAFSSPASSPRKNAHRRQRTSVVSISTNLPAQSGSAAAQAMQRALDPSTPRAGASSDPATESTPRPPATTPILVRKGETPENGQKRRSVRFSPKPEYRSDSGSGPDEDGSLDESALEPTQSLRVVNKQPTDSSASDDSDAGSHPPTQISLAPVERALRLGEQVQPEEEKQTVMPVTPATPQSFSVRLPGAYIPTPTQASPSVSRHVIRPSRATRPDFSKTANPWNSPARAVSPPLSRTQSVSSSPLSLSPRAPSSNKFHSMVRSPSAELQLSEPSIEEDEEEQDEEEQVERSLSLETPENSHLGSSDTDLSLISSRRGIPRESTPPRSFAELSNAVPFSKPVANPDDSVLTTVGQILATLKSTQAGGVKADANAVQQSAAVVVASETEAKPRVDPAQISLPDRRELEQAETKFVGQIEGLRGKLAELVSSFGSRLSAYPGKAEERLAAPSRLSMIVLVVFQVVVMWLMLQAAQARAEHLFQTVYTDPFFPAIYRPTESLGTGIPFFSTPSPRVGSPTSVHHEPLAALPRTLVRISLSLLETPLRILDFILHPQSAGQLDFHDVGYLVPT